MEEFLSKEWLVTNGIGGYASSSISCANTRTYHGILVASLKPPVDRVVIVPKLEERLFIENQYHDLSSNCYLDKIYPEGYKYLKDFKVIPNPTWYYTGENWKIEKSLSMQKGKNTTFVKYKNVGSNDYTIELHPLFSYIDFHQCRKENQQTDFYSEIEANYIKTFPYYGSEPFYTAWTEGTFAVNKVWYRNFKLPKEDYRGLESVCDYMRVGYVSNILKPGEEIIICFTTEKYPFDSELSDLYEATVASHFHEIKKVSFLEDLKRAGEQFLVERQSTSSKSILAGYHWFSDWGRDILISMRGLTIAYGKKETSESILNTLFARLDHGMLPNRFPDHMGEKVEYNSVDAALWMFIALYDYYLKFKDSRFITSKISELNSIIENYIQGCRYNIKVNDQGFVYAGEEGFQLTWMDAKVDGKVITPRIGCPVEITMLWFNALKIYEYFCHEFQIEFPIKYTEIVNNIESNFSKYYLNEQGFLNDVVIPNEKIDDKFRPNQVYAVSLPFTILNKTEKIKIFELIKEKLYTPYGLRTLDKENPEFIGEYSGNQLSRDSAYHQGTVWPFLIYEYFKAYFSIYGVSKENKLFVIKELEALKKHFYDEEGLYGISEIFDGDQPNIGKGCINQAWSVAALIKLFLEFDLDKLQPQP